MPDAFRARREGIDRLLQHVVSGVLDGADPISLDRDDLWVLLDALPIAVLVAADRACTRIGGNAAARELYRLPVGQNLSRSAPADERPPYEVFADGAPVAPEDLPLQKAARTGEPVTQSECEIRFADGRRIFIAAHSIPVRDEDGEVCGAIGAFLDLTPRQRELELSRIVSREMSHRLRNTIGIVQAMSRRMLRPLLSPDAYTAYEDRLVMLASRQDLLHKDDWKSVRLTQVVEAAMTDVFGLPRERIALSGPDLEIPAGSALPLSMILHELTTNALKYGALSGASGTVSVDWSAPPGKADGPIRLDWAERGGPGVSAPGADGFGRVMMAAAAASLPGGRIHLGFEAAGVTAKVTFRPEAPAL